MPTRKPRPTPKPPNVSSRVVGSWARVAQRANRLAAVCYVGSVISAFLALTQWANNSDTGLGIFGTIVAVLFVGGALLSVASTAARADH